MSDAPPPFPAAAHGLRADGRDRDQQHAGHHLCRGRSGFRAAPGGPLPEGPWPNALAIETAIDALRASPPEARAAVARGMSSPDAGFQTTAPSPACRCRPGIFPSCCGVSCRRRRATATR
ncbi:hypothetical protein RAA17_14925 [Komagataeibacter rhaeticus]|nr:hypothetical protein [Komagataeibacter rhaeticus]